MKLFNTLFKYGILTILLVAINGCTQKNYDSDIADLNDRLSSLETKMNTDIGALKTAITALESKDYVTSITALPDNSGYTIVFSKSGTITIKNGSTGQNGESPIIGVTLAEDGLYYWSQTIKGVTTLILDTDGNPISVSPVAAPTMGVDKDGYWTIDLHDGNGVKRIKDANGNDVKAVGKDGAPGSSGGTSGSHKISPDGKYVTITLSSGSFTIPYNQFYGLTFADGNELVYVGYGAGTGANPAHILTLQLPDDLTEAEYSALSVSMTGKAGGDADVVTKAAASGWKVEITKKPTFVNGVIDQTAGNEVQISITSPLDGTPVLTESERTAIIKAELVYKNGNTDVVTRPIQVTTISSTDWTTGDTFTIPAATAATNVIINVIGNISNAATIIIPAGTTVRDIPVITINVKTGMKFASSLTIANNDYDGLILLQAENTAAEIVAGDLTVTLPKGSFKIVSGKVTGTTNISTKPGTFTVGKDAVLALVKASSGSIVVEGTTSHITTSSADPIVVSGTVANITVEAPSGSAQVPATPITVKPEATSVGDITAENSELKVEPGASATNVGTVTAKSVEVTTPPANAEKVTIGAVTATNVTVAAPAAGANASGVELGAITTVADSEGNKPTVSLGEGATAESIAPATDSDKADITVDGKVTGDVEGGKVDAKPGAVEGEITGDEVMYPIMLGDAGAPIFGGKTYATFEKACEAATDGQYIWVKPGEYSKDIYGSAIDAKVAGVKVNGVGSATLAEIAAAGDFTICKDITITSFSATGGLTKTVKVFGTIKAITNINAIILKGVTTQAELQSGLTPAANYNGIVLANDIAVTNNTNSQACVETASANFVFDGNGFTLSGRSNDGKAPQNILVIGGGESTVRNLTITPIAGSGAINGMCVYGGLNVSSPAAPSKVLKATLDNVTIKNCGKTGLIVQAASGVVATNLTTSGNTWGGVNIDPKKANNLQTPYLTLSGSVNIGENAKVWADNVDGLDEATVKAWLVTDYLGWVSAFVYGEKTKQYLWGTVLPSSIVHNETTNVGYGDLVTAVTAASAGDVLAINWNVTLGAENIKLTKALTFKGNGYKVAVSESGGFTLEASTKFDNITIDGDNAIGKAPITINAADVALTGDKLIINQATSGNGDGTSKSGLGIVIVESGDINNATITLTNSAINLNGTKGYQRAIAFPTSIAQSGMVINMTNSTVTSYTTEAMPNATYSQGISMGLLSRPEVSLVNCVFDGMYYPISCAGTAPTNLELTIDNSKLTGYCALNLRGTSAIVVKNGSVLTGRNFYKVGSNDFATIVYNQGVASGTITIDNSTIKNLANNTAQQWMIDLRQNTGVFVTLRNNTKLIDMPTEPGLPLDFMIDDVVEGSTITADATVVLQGKPGVQLYEKK